jgi:hypothetical protein
MEQREHCSGEEDEEIGRIGNPEDRIPIQQNVAQRATADRGDYRDDCDAEPVDAYGRRRAPR